MRYSFMISVGVTAVFLALSGCSSEESGTAEPELSDVAQSSIPSEVPETNRSSPQSSNGLADVKPCSLLTTDELKILGEYQEGVDKLVGSGRVCQWKEVRDPDTGQSATLTVTLRENGGLDDHLDQGYGERRGMTDTTGRAVKELPTSIGCVVMMAVGESERVEVAASKVGSDLTRQDFCKMVGEVAEIIDPKLPRG